MPRIMRAEFKSEKNAVKAAKAFVKHEGFNNAEGIDSVDVGLGRYGTSVRYSISGRRSTTASGGWPRLLVSFGSNDKEAAQAQAESFVETLKDHGIELHNPPKESKIHRSLIKTDHPENLDVDDKGMVTMKLNIPREEVEVKHDVSRRAEWQASVTIDVDVNGGFHALEQKFRAAIAEDKQVGSHVARYVAEDEQSQNRGR